MQSSVFVVFVRSVLHFSKAFTVVLFGNLDCFFYAFCREFFTISVSVTKRKQSGILGFFAFLQNARPSLSAGQVRLARLISVSPARSSNRVRSSVYFKRTLLVFWAIAKTMPKFDNHAMETDCYIILTATERLAGVLRRRGKLSYAKKLLQDAAKLDVTSHTVWWVMACICRLLLSNCLILWESTAVDLMQVQNVRLDFVACAV